LQVVTVQLDTAIDILRLFTDIIKMCEAAVAAMGRYSNTIIKYDLRPILCTYFLESTIKLFK